MRSIGLFLIVLCAACGPISRHPPPTADSSDVSPGDVLEVSPKVEVQALAVRAPARIFVVQHDRLLLTMDVDDHGRFPRAISIPIGTLPDRTDQTIYVVVGPPGALLHPDDHCIKCLACCPSPPLVTPSPAGPITPR